MSCISCAQGFIWECRDTTEDGACCCNGLLHPDNFLTQSMYAVEGETKAGRPELPDSEVKDPRSTMRKRAQKVLKQVRNIGIGDKCEWTGMDNCGGGRNPIAGCEDGIVAHVHHGPDKDWYKNTPTNLHAICHKCHNRWHAGNDDDYDPRIPHQPVKRGK